MADSEVDESMNESQDDHNTTYNTDGVDEEDPGTVDPDVATFEEIFGADDDEEEEQPTKAAATYEDDLEEEATYEERPQQAIGSPLRLVTNPLPTPPEDSEVVRVKLPNIVGIQSKPFTHQALDEELSAFDEEDDEGRKKKHSIAESQIRWRYAVDGTKESNARIVRWSDGSMHLMLGNELLEMTPHNLTNEHLYLYARQPGFLHSQGRLNKKVVIRPASLDNKLHQKLSMALAEKNQKISKVKLVTTMVDPEVEKAKKEEEETKRIKTQQGSQVMKSRIMNRFGLDSDYLEQTGDYDRERDDNRHDNRNSYSSSSSFSSQSNRGRFGRNEYDKSDGFIEDDEDEEEDELDDRRDRNKHKKRPRRDEEDTERLMNAKRDVEAPKKQTKPTKEKEKEKKPSRKEEKREEEEEEEEETTTTTTQDVAEIEGEDEETNVVKRPAKARKGVIVDDDEDM